MSNIQFLTDENLTESVATAQTLCLSGGQSIKTVLVSLCENKKLFASKKIILSDERESCNRDDSNYHTLKSILPNCCEIIEPKDMWRDARTRSLGGGSGDKQAGSRMPKLRKEKGQHEEKESRTRDH